MFFAESEFTAIVLCCWAFSDLDSLKASGSDSNTSKMFEAAGGLITFDQLSKFDRGSLYRSELLTFIDGLCDSFNLGVSLATLRFVLFSLMSNAVFRSSAA